MGSKGHFFAAGITLAATSAASAQFWSVGTPDGWFSSGVNGLSRDGSVAVGSLSGGPNVGYIWTRESGRYDYGYEPQFPSLPTGLGVSGDGRVAVGRVVIQVSGNEQFRGRAYRWTGPGTFELLGDPGRDVRSAAIDANHDGSVIVGNLTNSRGTDIRPFRWTAAGGLQSLGFAGAGQTEAHAISDDGNRIIGTESGSSRGFVWTPEHGYEIVQGHAGGNGFTGLYGMNRAGTIYVGMADAAGGGLEGAMWINDTVVNLGILAGTRDFQAKCVNDTGTVVAGDSSPLLTGDPFKATVWTQLRGIESLSDYLASQGVTIPMGVVLSSCSSISADGRTFAGSAFTQGNVFDGFGYVVTIPAPTSVCIVLGAVALSGFRQRRRSLT